MHQQIIWLTLACCMTAASVASESKHSNASPSADAKQQVLDLGKEWVAAEVKHDTATLRRILDEKFVASFGAEKPYDKEAFIKAIVGGDVDPTGSQTLTDETVIVDHDTVRGTENGAADTMVYRYTVTYEHRQGRWLALAEHLVKVPPAQ